MLLFDFNYALKDIIFSAQDWKDYSNFKSKMQNEFDEQNDLKRYTVILDGGSGVLFPTFGRNKNLYPFCQTHFL